MTTAVLLKSQMEYAALQVELLGTHIGTSASLTPIPILRRVQDQFRDLASSLRIALQAKV